MAAANSGCNQDLCKTKPMKKEARGCGTFLVEEVGVGLLTPWIFMMLLRSRKLCHVEKGWEEITLCILSSIYCQLQCALLLAYVYTCTL